MPVATTDKKEKIPVQEDERLLIRRAQKDPEEFRHLFDLYHDAIFNYVLRRTFDVVRAQDITSNTFLKALDNLNKFHWKGVGFSAWLYRIATNEINLSYRNQNKTVPLSEDITKRTKDELTADHALIQAEENMLRNEKFREMHAALAQLDEKYQTVLSLKYFEEKSTKEVAEILGISENTVKTHTRRGLLKLRDIL